jgi:hypothetical protein
LRAPHYIGILTQKQGIDHNLNATEL